MKKIVFIVFVLLLSEVTFSQITFTSNENPVGMEHNMLFNATTRSRFQVTQTGSAALSLDYLFDGKFIPSYTSTPPTLAEPTVVLIKGLVNWHTQQGAWVGWSTRYWGAKRFKIEGYNVHVQSEWRTIADYSTQDYTGGGQFLVKVPSGSYTELRFTFYEGTGPDGNLGVSELFYLHPEAVRPYEGLLGGTNDKWNENANNLFTNKRVGIGTDTPSHMLEVKSGVYQTYFTGNAVTFKNTNESSYIDKKDSGSLNFRMGEGSSTVLTMTNNLHVGIGKTTPTEKLHIEGNLLIDAFEKGNESGIFFREGFSQSNKYNLSILAYNHNGSSADGLSVNGFDGISFSTGAGIRNERMRIKQNGNVGIGTIETGSHKLAVEGSIGAREIKVEATGWSDFVFENEYKLPTLKEVENHIKEKGHLKDIPSEAEVLKNGFYLGEMDSKLLQKIEELTLYTIQQEKQLKEQAKNIKRLEALVEKLLESKKQNTAK